MGAAAFFSLSGLPGSAGRPTPPSAAAALALVLAASLTDYLDGAVARRATRIATSAERGAAPGTPWFGPWIDAFADFFLFLCVYGALFRSALAPGWLFTLFLAREATMYLIIRPAAVRLGLDHGARLAGKIKTVLQYVGVIGLLVLLSLPAQLDLAADLVDAIVAATLTVLIVVSAGSLYWYLNPLFAAWPSRQRGLPQQLLAVLLGLTLLQLAFYQALAPQHLSRDSFLIGIVLFHVAIGGFLFWRHEEFAPLEGTVREQVANLALPNVVTLLRLSSIPTLSLLWGHGPRTGTLPVLVATTACVFLTDLFDGALARRRSQVTRVGGYLDSGSDYLALLALAALLAAREIVPLWLAALLITRLLLNAIAMAVVRIRRPRHVPGPTTWGKISVATAMWLITVELLVHAVTAGAPGAALARAVLIAELATAAVLAVSLLDKWRYFRSTMGNSP